MSRLIDADELIKRLNEKALAQHDIPLVEHDFRELIHDAPTVDDVKVVAYTTVVEVVRCKDCKYWNDAGLCKKHSNPIVGAIYGTDADDYCSEGKRKEQGHE